MGIRCYCPNGHKLNLKSFLAGKKGVCPKCKVKFRIPEQSDPQLERAKEAVRAARSDGQNGSQSAAARQTQPTHPQPSSSPAAKTPAAKPHPAASQSADATAVKDEPPVWYVRPPSGGEFGPASDADFRAWLAEGRITSDSFVWFTGWPDWIRASDALPDAFADGDAAVPMANNAATDNTSTNVTTAPASQSVAPTAGIVVGESTAQRAVSAEDPHGIQISVDAPSAPVGDPVELYRKRKSTKMAVTVIVLLSLACAVLLAGLVWAIRFR